MEENNKLVKFIFNQNREVIAEKETEWTSYIRGSTLLASSAEHARTYYHFASDEMSSVTHIVDDEKVLNEYEYEYDAWGEVVSQKETVKNRFKFNGQQLDPITQQYYLRARFYNPVIARFTQEDTYRGDGLNLYAYCGNNPVYYVDPTGNKAQCDKDAFEKARDQALLEGKSPEIARALGKNAANINKRTRVTEKNARKAENNNAPKKPKSEIPTDRPMNAKEAKEAAAKLDYEPVGGNQHSHHQPVFYNKKTRKYITADVGSNDGKRSHNGGVWKMADSIGKLRSKNTRDGTCDANLNKIGE